jgi:hypothetical protein
MSVPMLGRAELKSAGSLGSSDNDAAASSGDASRRASTAAAAFVLGSDRLPVNKARGPSIIGL